MKILVPILAALLAVSLLAATAAVVNAGGEATEACSIECIVGSCSASGPPPCTCICRGIFGLGGPACSCGSRQLVTPTVS